MSRAFVTDKEDWVYCAKAAKPKPTQPRRTTKKSTLKKPKKWGGRSGG